MKTTFGWDLVTRTTCAFSNVEFASGGLAQSCGLAMEPTYPLFYLGLKSGSLIHEKKDAVRFICNATLAYQQNLDEVYEGFFKSASALRGSIVLTTCKTPTSTCEQFLNLTLKNE